MGIDTTFLRNCINALEIANGEIGKHDKSDSALYDVFRASCIKEFELVLELSGKILRKTLGLFYANNKLADKLPFKDVFRYAAKHGLLELDVIERWMQYRDYRNSSAHEYVEQFAESILQILPDFIDDAKTLVDTVERVINEQ